MSVENEQEASATVRREASFLRRAEPIREISTGKLAVLAAVLIAALSGAVTLMVLR